MRTNWKRAHRTVSDPPLPRAALTRYAHQLETRALDSFRPAAATRGAAHQLKTCASARFPTRRCRARRLHAMRTNWKRAHRTVSDPPLPRAALTRYAHQLETRALDSFRPAAAMRGAAHQLKTCASARFPTARQSLHAMRTNWKRAHRRVSDPLLPRAALTRYAHPLETRASESFRPAAAACGAAHQLKTCASDSYRPAAAAHGAYRLCAPIGNARIGEFPTRRCRARRLHAVRTTWKCAHRTRYHIQLVFSSLYF
uniref:Uncharacterized protein n=1 Tax=Psilocybe cubensis TaxID=181762 RepID=A0A8H7XWL3_PSICU